MTDKLAIDGGKSALSSSLDSYEWIDEETIVLVSELLRTQQLSGFLGQQGPQYLGGKWLRRLEAKVQDYGNHHFAVGFNSWTSGLNAMFHAMGLDADSEVLVPTWTMSATISAIVNAGLRPVFVDIDEETFNISVPDAKLKLNSNTSAICAIDLFGMPSPIFELREIADKAGIKLVTDSAQCPGGRINQISPSKVADLGGYSFNRHKHLQAGEGGMVVTDDEVFASRLRAIRNHGEIAAPEVTINSKPIYGHNWRLGEIESLITYQQYLKVDAHIQYRREVAYRLRQILYGIPGLILPNLNENVLHDFYILGMRLAGNVNRTFVEKSLRAEGLHFLVTNYSGLENLRAFLHFQTTDLPVSKRLNDREFLGLYLAGFKFEEVQYDEIQVAFEKTFHDSRAFL